MGIVKYGIDAPDIIRNLIIFCALTAIFELIISTLLDNTVIKFVSCLIIIGGSIFFMLGIAMFAYGMKGKYRTRDLRISKIKWTSKETMLYIFIVLITDNTFVRQPSK